MDYNIRKAKKSDLENIRNLVVELAIFEKEPNAVTATLKDYQINFEKGVFDAIIIEEDNKVIGTCIYYMTWSTWKGRMLYLEDFVITQAYRQRGLGQFLFNALLEEAKNLNVILVKWQVLDWNEPAIKFYEKNKAIIEKNWWNGKILFNEIKPV